VLMHVLHENHTTHSHTRRVHPCSRAPRL